MSGRTKRISSYPVNFALVIAGGLVYVTHQQYTANIWTEGPGAGAYAVEKSFLCGLGATFMAYSFAQVFNLNSSAAVALTLFHLAFIVLIVAMDVHSGLGYLQVK